MRKRLRNHFIPHEGNDYKPHFVRERNLAGIALLVVAVFGLAYSIKSLITTNPGLLSAVITSILVDETNTERLSENLKPLEFNPILASAAQLKANDMVSKTYFAHTSPEGKSPWYWFKESGYKFIYAGENLAVNFVDSEDVVRAWMNSQGHRANILNDKFSEIGIAIASGVYNGSPSIYVVQLFGRPAPKAQVSKPVVLLKESAPLTSTKLVTSAVSGANVEVLSENKMFIAVKSKEYEDMGQVQLAKGKQIIQASAIDMLLAAPKRALRALYFVLGGVVLLTLLLFVWIKPRHLHKKNVVYTVLLLLLIIFFIYLSSALIFPQILIE